MSVFGGRKTSTHGDRLQKYEEEADKILEALDFDAEVEFSKEEIEKLDEILVGLQELIDSGFLSVDDLKESSRPRK